MRRQHVRSQNVVRATAPARAIAQMASATRQNSRGKSGTLHAPASALAFHFLA